MKIKIWIILFRYIFTYNQNIRKALLTIKIKQKKDYDIRIALINSENAQNNVMHTITKYKPKQVFNNNNETQNEIVKDNIKKSQININKNISYCF